MNIFEITSAQYTDNNQDNIRATIEGQEMFVPIDLSNRHYAEIMRQVEAGELTIQDAV